MYTKICRYHAVKQLAIKNIFLPRNAIQTSQLLTVLLYTTGCSKFLIKMLNSQPLIFLKQISLR